jgi:hypothetical protein
MASVLIMLTLILGVIFVYAGAMLTQSELMKHREKRLKAQYLAESGLAEAIARFRLDHNFGKGEVALRELIPYPEDPKAGFSVHFSPSASINNWGADAPVYLDQGKSQVACPAGGVYLTAVGTYMEHSESVSALLGAPAFNSAIASRGPLEVRGDFLLGTVASDFDEKQPIRKEDLRPSEMQADGVLSLSGGKSVIVGNARASKDAIYNADLVEIRDGKIEPNVQVDALPDIAINSLSFKSREGVLVLSESRYAEAEKMGGLIEWSGTKLVFEKGLHLNNGVFLSHGDIEIQGGISGAGALLCEGKVTLIGSSELSADNQVAVVSDKGISVSGASQEHSFFRGLLYTKGPEGISISQSTVVGALVSFAPGASTTVEKSRVVFSKKAISFDVTLSWTGYDEAKGIDATTKSVSGDIPAFLKLAPLPGMAAGSQPKPGDLIKANVAAITADLFLLTETDPVSKKTTTYFSKTLPEAVKQQLLAGQCVEDPGSKISDAFDAVKIKFDGEIPKMRGLMAELTAPDGNKGTFGRDLNKFFKTSDRLHIVWKR